MFKYVRNEPEFQEILTSIKTKYQKIHDEVVAIVRKYTFSITLEGRTTKFKVKKSVSADNNILPSFNLFST